MQVHRRLAATVALVAAVVSCAPSAATGDGLTVGFIFVGQRDDLGYNQAAWEGSETLARRHPEVAVLRVENVPETAAATQALERLIDQGASILFATSFGHLDAAVEVARRHPDVVVLHQGGTEPAPPMDNLGTYFGPHEQLVYVAGVMAAAAADRPHFGYVAAFPIPATYNNVNAFTLGARSVDPDATTEVVFTGSWCDHDAQERAARDLIARGATVLAQHQDCTSTILGIASREGALAVGYHTDGSEVAGAAWVTGVVWLWGDLFSDILETVRRGGFPGSVYDEGFRGEFAGGVGPVILTEPGPAVTTESVELASVAEARVAAEGVFAGPLRDRDGRLRVAAGERLDRDAIDTMDWFVEGVVGEAPR